MSHLNKTQLLTLKAAILGETDTTFVAFRAVNDRNSMATWYNGDSTFTVWKSTVTIAQMGIGMNSSEIAGLTTANNSRLQVMAAYSGGTFNPSITDVRAGFDNVFSGAGGVLTRTALLTLWKRIARRVERLYATGTGSDAVPGLLVFEGTIDRDHIDQALEAV